MQFDIVIGNPPYQEVNNPTTRNKLWFKFIYQAIDNWSKPDGIITFVNPSSWFKSPSSKKFTKLGQHIAQHWLKYINLNTSKDHFPTVGEDICHYTIVKGQSGQTKVVWDKTQHIQYTGGWQVLEPNDALKISILNKMTGDKTNKLNNIIIKDYKDINGNWKTYINQGIMSEQPTAEFNTEVYYTTNKTVLGK